MKASDIVLNEVRIETPGAREMNPLFWEAVDEKNLPDVGAIDIGANDYFDNAPEPLEVCGLVQGKDQRGRRFVAANVRITQTDHWLGKEEEYVGTVYMWERFLNGGPIIVQMLTNGPANPDHTYSRVWCAVQDSPVPDPRVLFAELEQIGIATVIHEYVCRSKDDEEKKPRTDSWAFDLVE